MAQVAEVVSQVIRLADTDVLVEAWAAQEAPAVGVDEAVLQVTPITLNPKTFSTILPSPRHVLTAQACCRVLSSFLWDGHAVA